MSSNQDSSNGEDVSAPLYITVGPPCSGKTTWLKERKEKKAQGQEDGSLLDISLDDQPYVYIPVPFDLMVMSASEIKGCALSQEHQDLLKRPYFMKTIQERILAAEQTELRAVLKRLSGKITAAEFESSIRSLLPAKENKPNDPANNTKATRDAELALKTLVESINKLMGTQAALTELPPTVNLFVVEALFEKDPTLQMDRWTGIERATNLLRQTPKSTPVAWGNTNTKGKDYLTALQIAQEQNRPVYFCVYGDNNRYAPPTDGVPLFDLPKLEFHQLVDRNLQRLVQTGQYIPCSVIMGLCGRVDKLISDATRNSDTIGGRAPTKFEFDRQLARLARDERAMSFDLLEDRRPVMKQNYDRNGASYQWQNRNGNRNAGGRYYQGRGNQATRQQHFQRYQDSRYRQNYSNNYYNRHRNNSFNLPNDPLGSSGQQGRGGGRGRDYRQPDNQRTYGSNYHNRQADNQRNYGSNYHNRQDQRQEGNGYVPPRNGSNDNPGIEHSNDRHRSNQSDHRHNRRYGPPRNGDYKNGTDAGFYRQESNRDCNNSNDPGFYRYESNGKHNNSNPGFYQSNGHYNNSNNPGFYRHDSNGHYNNSNDPKNYRNGYGAPPSRDCNHQRESNGSAFQNTNEQGWRAPRSLGHYREQKQQQESAGSSWTAPRSRDNYKRQRDVTADVDPWTDVGDASRYRNNNEQQQQYPDERTQQRNINSDYYG